MKAGPDERDRMGHDRSITGRDARKKNESPRATEERDLDRRDVGSDSNPYGKRRGATDGPGPSRAIEELSDDGREARAGHTKSASLGHGNNEESYWPDGDDSGKSNGRRERTRKGKGPTPTGP